MNQRIKEHIQRMTRDEKFEEFRLYLATARVLNLDIDRIKMDQAIVGAPDSAIGEALEKFAHLAGTMLGELPVTAQELHEIIKQRRDERSKQLRGAGALEQSVVSFSEPQLNMRKNTTSSE